VSVIRMLLLPAALSVGVAAGLGAQTDSPPAAARFDSRARLEAEARAAESAHRDAQAFLLRARLKNGDFQEGDRIIVVLESTPTVLDTMQVRTGKMLQFPRMADLSLEGVLRSELTDTLRRHLGRFLTKPGVRATPLLPVAVFGSVRNPGYYYTAADVVLRDVIMRAGGPLADADINHAVVRRAGQIIWNADDVRVALTDGLSLDRLHMHAGDEIFVPQRKQRVPVTTIVSILSASVAATLAILQMAHH